MSPSSKKLPLRWIHATQSSDQSSKTPEVYSHVTSKYRRWARTNRLLTQLKSSTNRILGRNRQSVENVDTHIEQNFTQTVSQLVPSQLPLPQSTVSLARNSSQTREYMLPPVLPPKLAHGNSDPFSATSVPLTARVNEILYLRIHRFVVFGRRAYFLGTKLRDRWVDQFSAQHRQSISCAALTHALLVSGCCARAAMTPLADRKNLMSQARAHKIKAIAVLRCYMKEASFQPSIDVYHVITDLASVDFAMGEPESAMIHHRAVTDMVNRPDFHDLIYLKGTLGAMAEVDIIRALAVQPNFSAIEWCIDISSTGIDDIFWYDPIQSLNVRQPPLNCLFDKSRTLLRLKQTWDGSVKATHILTSESLALEKRLVFLSIYYRSSEVNTFLQNSKRILTSVTHALLWFLDVIFIESMHQGFAHGLFNPYRLNVLFLQSPDFGYQPVRRDLYLWLTFMVIASEVLASIDSSSIVLSQHIWLFHSLRLSSANPYSQDMTKCLLMQYLYHDEIMGPILDQIWPLSDPGQLADHGSSTSEFPSPKQELHHSVSKLKNDYNPLGRLV